MNVLAYSCGYSCILLWIFLHTLVDILAYSCGYSCILLWIFLHTLVDILAYSCGYSSLLLYIPDDLKQVSNTVAGVDLSDHVVQVVFTLFDENSRCMENVTVLFMMYTVILQLYVSDSFVHRPSHHPVFLVLLQYAKNDCPLYHLKRL